MPLKCPRDVPFGSLLARGGPLILLWGAPSNPLFLGLGARLAPHLRDPSINLVYRDLRADADSTPAHQLGNYGPVQSSVSLNGRVTVPALVS